MLPTVFDGTSWLTALPLNCNLAGEVGAASTEEHMIAAGLRVWSLGCLWLFVQLVTTIGIDLWLSAQRNAEAYLNPSVECLARLFALQN